MADRPLGTLAVRVTADLTGFTAGMKTLDRRVQRTKTYLTRMNDTTLTLQGTIRGLAGAAGLGYLAKSIFDLGSAVEETDSKFATVFGDAADGVQDFAESFASLAGLTERQAKDTLATMGAITQGMGAARAESGRFAESVVRLAADWSSFNNVPIEESLNAIRSAMTGEYEPTKRFGVILSAAEVEARAMADTGKRLKKELTDLEKAQARLNLMYEKSGPAVGDVIRTSESAANRFRRLAAEILTTRDAYAKALLPAMAEVLNDQDKLIDSLKQQRAWLETNAQAITAWARVGVASVRAVWEVFENLFQVLFNIGYAIGGLVNALAAIRARNFEGMKAGWEQTANALKAVRDNALEVGTAFTELENTAAMAWTATEAAAVRAGQALTGEGSGSGPGIIRPVEDATVAVIQWGEETIQTLKGTATAWKKSTNQWAGSLSGVLSGFSNALGDTLRDGMDAWRAFADYAIQQILRIAAKAAVLRILGSFIAPTSFLGSVLGLPGRAAGGPVSAGKPYVVGESGRELFVPHTSGHIEPATSPAMTGGGDVVVHLTLVTPDGREQADRITYRQRRDERLGRSIRIPLPMGV